MYTSFFGLRCLPFEDRAEPQFFYPAAEHEEALAAMEYEAHFGTGMGLVLGESGTGKTLLVRTLLSRLHATDHAVVLTAPGNGSAEILRECCKGFGVSLPASPNEAKRLSRLRRHLERTLAAGHRAILIVDQAEHLTAANLGEIETLAGLGAEDGKLLRVVLAGHPRFRAMLERPEQSRLRQMAFGERVLPALSAAQTSAYIRHRLGVAGAGDVELFNAESLGIIHAASGGVPRLINQICNACLLSAYGAGDRRISASVVAEVSGVPLDTLRGGTAAGAARNEALSSEGTRMESERTIPRHNEAVASTAIANGPADPLSDFAATVSRAEAAVDLPVTESGRSATELAAWNRRIAAAEARLLVLIERAERAAETVSRCVPQAADSAGQAHRRIERFLGDADERVRMLEARLADAASRVQETLGKTHRVERACQRADEVESRLAELSEQMADRVEDVQARVAQLLNHLSPAEEAGARLEGEIARANAAAVEMDRTSNEAAAQWNRERTAATAEAERMWAESAARLAQERSAAEQAIRELAAAEAEGSRKRIREHSMEAERISGECAARLVQERSAAEKAIRELASAETEGVRKRIDEQTNEFERSRKRILGALEAGASAASQRAMSVLAEAETKVTEAEARLEREGKHTLQVLERGAASVRENAVAAAEATRNAEATLERVGSAQHMASTVCNQLAKAVGGANQAVARIDETIERLGQLEIDGNVLASRLEAEVKAGQQIGDVISSGIALADQKIPPLASATAAAHHIHDQLSRLVASNEEAAKQAEETVQRVASCLVEAGSRVEQYEEQLRIAIAAGAEQIERIETTRHAAHDDAVQLEEQFAEGSRVSSALERMIEEGNRSVHSLDEHLEAVRPVVAKMESLSSALRDGHELNASLWKGIEAGGVLRDEVSSFVERCVRERGDVDAASAALAEMSATTQQVERNAQELLDRLAEGLTEAQRRADIIGAEAAARLDEASAEWTTRVEGHLAAMGKAETSLQALMQAHGPLEEQMRGDLERLENYLALVRQSMESGAPLVREYRAQVGDAAEKLAWLGERLTGLEKQIEAGMTGARVTIENAQGQAEHLERVCTAVRKVFAGLSQASLQAKEQTEGLRQIGVEAKEHIANLTEETERCRRTLQNWLEEASRVHGRLGRVGEERPSPQPAHPVESVQRVLRRLGRVERTASMRIKDEPGAASARNVEGGLETLSGADVSPRAREIARLIAEAKQEEAEAVAR